MALKFNSHLSDTKELQLNIINNSSSLFNLQEKTRKLIITISDCYLFK